MLDTLTPVGSRIEIPEWLTEDRNYFTAAEGADARAYYDEHGYVVIRGLVDPASCQQVRATFNKDARHSPVPMLRQKNMRYERNSLDSDGFLSNPIFNVQDLGSGRLGSFRNAVLDILTSQPVSQAVANLLRADRAKVIQSMFFEAPAGTWAHQDSYYQDSASELGSCVAGWFAIEDIDAGAGRFYVCPGSHRAISPLRNEGANNFATGHQTYKDAMLETIRQNGLSIRAPFLAAGDVLFWNSLTVHGSLPAARPGVSRTSLTAHYLRADDKMLQFHSRIREQKTTTYNGMQVGLLHDQDVLRNQIVRDIAFHFPGPYMAARRLALRAVMAKRALAARISR